MDLTVVGQARLFENLTPDRVAAIWPLLEPKLRRLKKGDLLIRDGQHVTGCGIVETGTLSANKLYADGHLSLMVKFLPGFVVGYDIAATKTQRSTYYVTALQNAEVWWFDYSRIACPGTVPEPERLCIMQSLLALVAGENLRKMNKIEILSRKGVREKILTYLSLQSSFHGSRSFAIPFNREELADYLCLNRSRLSHELSRMQQEGLIRYKKNYFEVINADLYRYKETF